MYLNIMLFCIKIICPFYYGILIKEQQKTHFFKSENKIEYIANLVGLMKKKRLVSRHIIRKYIKIWTKGDTINEKLTEMFSFLWMNFCHCFSVLNKYSKNDLLFVLSKLLSAVNAGFCLQKNRVQILDYV